MKSFRDDLIDRMKTGWGRFVLASSTTLSFIQIDLISYEQLTIGVRDGGEEKKQSQNMETF
jgi:hypothetical protein